MQTPEPSPASDPPGAGPAEPDRQAAAGPEPAREAAPEPGPQAAPEPEQGAGPGAEPGAEPGAGTDPRAGGAELFDQMLAQARRGLDPSAVVSIVAEMYERIMPDMQRQLRAKLSERLDAQPMNPDMKQMVRRLNEEVVGQMFARAATVFRTKGLDRMRGLAEEERE